MISDRLRRLRKQLARNNQRGFTLIELLVVVSILGILAAVVTMSLYGITSRAQARAAAAEKSTVQTAYDTMLADQEVPAGSECPASGQAASSNMTSFPASAQPGADAAHAPVALAPNYLHTTTHGTYACVPGGGGAINQVSYTP